MAEEEKNKEQVPQKEKTDKKRNKKVKIVEPMSDIDRFHKFYSDALTKILAFIGFGFLVVGVIVPVWIQNQQKSTFKDEADDIKKEVRNDFNMHASRVDTKVANAEAKLHSNEQTIARIDGAIASTTNAIVDLTKYFDRQIHRIELRLVRIENNLALDTPQMQTSPMALTDLGKDMLRKSGMDSLLAKYKSELMEKVKAYNLTASTTVYEVERVAKLVIAEFPDWGTDEKVINDYMFEHPNWKMFNIWELAGLRFRDMILEELGMPVPTYRPKQLERPFSSS